MKWDSKNCLHKKAAALFPSFSLQWTFAFLALTQISHAMIGVSQGGDLIAMLQCMTSFFKQKVKASFVYYSYILVN